MFHLSEKNPLPPRIVLVQALLRYKGINVRITGKWDQQTIEAIGKYRTKLNLQSQGPVDKNVFFNLIQNTKLKTIDSVDASGGKPSYITEQHLKKAGVSPLSNPPKRGEGVKNAINLIVNRAKNHRIALLRFHGHGNRGTLIGVALGDPVHAPTQAAYDEMLEDFYSYIDYTHFEQHRSVLRQLTPLFAPFASVEVNSCQIGNQKELLVKLANTWGVPVSGGFSNQFTGETYVNEYGEKCIATFRMEGNIFTAYPDDLSLEAWAAKVEKALPNLPNLINQAQNVISGLSVGR